MVFPTFFNLRLNFAIRSSWPEPQSAPGLVYADYRASPLLAAKNIINLISVLTIWWCPCVESSLVLLEKGVRWGNNENSERLFFQLQNHCRWWLQPLNSKTLAPWKKSYFQPRQRIKKQRHYFANKGPSCQSYCFSRSHVWMCELDYKNSWAPKNWCFWTVVWRRLLRVTWTARRSITF